MTQIEIDNLGIPPLAGICSYEEACLAGYSVEDTVDLLKRYNFVLSRLNQIGAAHLPATPEWEVKSALSLHMWMDAEHSAWLRKRITEMREPPLHLDASPDDALEAWLAEAIRASNTTELLTGLYQVIRPALAQAMDDYLAGANPLADHPTRRVLRFILLEQEDMIAWGGQALTALQNSESNRNDALEWQAHLDLYLAQAGGIGGAQPRPGDLGSAVPRSDGQPFEMDPMPQRDDRITNSYDQSFSGEISGGLGEDMPVEQRALVLLHRRLQEMDVPEWMAAIIYKTDGKAWAYYQDMSRQLWDEARHAMMGEVGLYSYGVPFYKYPIGLEGSVSLNLEFEPLDSHIILWDVEQGLMKRETGKRFEMEMAQSAADPLVTLFQDFDWADEVLHAQIGRKWLLPEVGSAAELRRRGKELRAQWFASMNRLKDTAPPVDWWPDFMAEVGGRPKHPVD
jgi:hypothetical protein